MLSTARESLRPWHLRSRLAPAGLTTLLHGGRPPLQPPSSSVLSEGLARSRLSVTPDTGFLLFPHHRPTSSLLCVFTALTFFCLESSHSSFKSCPIAASPGKSFTFLPPTPTPSTRCAPCFIILLDFHVGASLQTSQSYYIPFFTCSAPP